MNIQKLASEILKESADRQTINKIKMLWAHYKHNVDLFAKKVGQTIKDNKLSFSSDRNWLLNFLKDLTGEPWVIQGADFVVASKIASSLGEKKYEFKNAESANKFVNILRKEHWAEDVKIQNNIVSLTITPAAFDSEGLESFTNHVDKLAYEMGSRIYIGSKKVTSTLNNYYYDEPNLQKLEDQVNLWWNKQSNETKLKVSNFWRDILGSEHEHDLTPKMKLFKTKATEEIVSIDKIFPNQENIDIEVVREYMKNSPSRLPKGLKFSDENVILFDGHHTTAAKILNGEKFIKLLVLDANNLLKDTSALANFKTLSKSKVFEEMMIKAYNKGSEAKFKIGDKVSSKNLGIGTILMVDPNFSTRQPGFFYQVKYDDSGMKIMTHENDLISLKE